jgi:hypothetical protein
LQQVSLDERIVLSEDLVFAKCTSLKQIHLPKATTEIPASTFEDCTALERSASAAPARCRQQGIYGLHRADRFEIPGTVRTLGFEAFKKCTGLETMTIRHQCAKRQRAFFAMLGLVSVTIAAPISTIPDSMFSGCSA